MQVTTVADDLGFTEGPVALPDGRVALTSINHGCVYVVAPDGTVLARAPQFEQSLLVVDVDAADPHTGILITDSFGLNADNLHFSAAGQQSIGEGFALETAYYEWMTDQFSASDINTGLAEQTGDRDGDGQSNFREFMAATNPTSNASVFSANFTYQSTTNADISYFTSVSRFYSVEHYREIDATWEESLPALSGTGTEVTRPLGLSGPRGLYRVKVRLP